MKERKKERKKESAFETLLQIAASLLSYFASLVKDVLIPLSALQTVKRFYLRLD